MSLVNYLGTYETLDQVWEAYPEGGKEGDYLYIASVLKKWDKYASAWADPTEEDVDGSTIMSLEEDVVVGSSTLINYLGRFETLEDALNAYPEGGNEGDYIYVGDDIYAWDKYANEWVVSSDAPLEVAISEEDIIPNSNTFINYLGGFVDRDAVWQKYPEGGKVGDYLYIASDLHIWDRYICNWVAATPPDESSQIRPIEHLTQEGVVEYSENYINYLGVFESIEQAWEAYPEGGKEGDYIIVGGEQLRWNKYTANWGEYDPDASTPARPVATIYGDLHVHNDVIIGEDLYARILETFTTKKWVLEQGYISLDDVTSELVMSKIVPDNTTIEVRDGKLVVIGGGGSGTADSVEWDNITGKPDWIGDTKPTYTLDEIAGSNGDGFVTLLSDQTIEGVKNFANGAKFNGALLSYDEEKKAWVFPGNIIASGGITAFGSLSTPVASLFEALPIDGTTIKRDPVTNELYVDTKVVGGSGGGSVDPSQLEAYLKPYAKTADVASTYATIASLSAVTSRLNDFLAGSDTDAIINKWSELETFLAGLTETDNLATILSGKANKATTLAGYGITDAYTKSHIDSNFVTIGTKQEITGEKDFVGGFKVNGGLVEYNATLKAWVLNGDLLVTGGVSAFSNISGFKPSTITDAVLIDNRTIKRNADGLLYAVAQETDGINEEQLADYLTTNGYLTGITGKMVTNALGYTPLDKQGVAFDSNKFGGLSVADFARVKQEVSDFDANNMPDGVWGGKLFGSPNWALNYYAYLSAGSGNYKMQFNGVGNRLTYRAGNESGIENKDWVEILSSANYSNYALPLTGGTVDGDVTANIYYANKGFILSNVGDEYSGLAAGSHISSVGNAKDIWLYNSSADIKVYTPTIFSVLGGNVALGGATASEKLHVYGNMLFEGEAALKSSLIGEVLYMSGSYLVIGGGSLAKGIPTYIDGQTVYVRAGNYVATFSDAGGLTWNGNILATGGITCRDNFRTNDNYYGFSVKSQGSEDNWYGVKTYMQFDEGATMGVCRIGTAFRYQGLVIGFSTGNDYNYNIPNEYNYTDVFLFGKNGDFLANGALRLGQNNRTRIIENPFAAYGMTLADSNNNPLVTVSYYDDHAYVFNYKNSNENSGIVFYDDGRVAVEVAENFRIKSKSASLSGIDIGSSDTDIWQISHRGSFSNNELHFYHNANGTWSNSVLSLISDGSVIVGNNLLAKGGITATNSSDERLKRNLRKFNASKVLMSLGGVWEYEYVDSEVQKNHIYEGTHYGLIYQNVKGTNLDVMCHEREDGFGTLNYIHQKFISLIAGAIIENISEVEKLKRDIRHLKAKVKQLEQRS